MENASSFEDRSDRNASRASRENDPRADAALTVPALALIMASRHALRRHERERNMDALWGLRGSIHVIRRESGALRGNAPGDPATRPVIVYLPEEYEREPQRRFPAVYCLTGFTGSGVMLLNTEGWTPNLPQRFEKLQAAGRAQPMILVMPDCFTRFGGSQYIDSTATGAYETYLIDEIVAWVDAELRTLPDPKHRGVMGKSSGGYGAIVHAMRHPETFGAVACHSGDMAFEYCYLPDFPKAATGIWRAGGVSAFLDAFHAKAKKSQEDMEVMNILAMAACYSPNPLRLPYGFDLPFDLETGALRADVWERWLDHDPLRLLERGGADALARARLVFLDCGLKDEWNLHLGARIFVRRLREKEIPHVHEEFEDGHLRITYRYERSLALLSDAMAG
jgi:enterochelin esterase family protein